MISDAYKNFILPWWNVLSFFVTYANIDQWQPSPAPLHLSEVVNPLDQWILSRLHSTIRSVTQSLDAFEVNAGAKAIYSFLDEVTNWYIRRSRRRFWKNDTDADKAAAYAVLYHIISSSSCLIAPFTPFLAEYMHRILSSSQLEAKKSVHLEPFPVAQEEWINPSLEESTAFVRELISAGLKLRKQLGIKARFPLSEAGWIAKKPCSFSEEMKVSVLEELNVKTLTIFQETKPYLRFEIKPNLPVLGRKYSQLIPQIKTALWQIDPESDWVTRLLTEGQQDVALAGETIHLIPEDVLISVQGVGDWVAAEIDQAYVVLNKQQSASLMEEGVAREVIHAIQQARKTLQLSVTDRIQIQWCSNQQKTVEAVERFSEDLRKEVLADSMEIGDDLPEASALVLDLPYEYGSFRYTVSLSGRAKKQTDLL
jgi:isoleucyl-tRNA synthetase